MTKGVGYMMLATFFFSLMNVFVKLIPHIPPVEIVLVRSLVTLVLSVGLLKSAGINLWGNNKKILIARGVAGSVSLLLYFKMLQEIPLASAYTILFLAPIFTTILGIFIVREKVYSLQWFFFLIAFAGIIMVKGFDTRIPLLHLFLGIGASLASGLAHNCIRKLNTTEHPLVIIFYFPLVTIPFTGVACLFDWHTPSLREWMILLAIGILTQIAQYFMTKSYQLEEISKVASLRYLGIIYALSFGYLFFDERFTVATHVGMIVVLLGVVLNIWYKHRKLKADQSIFRGEG